MKAKSRKQEILRIIIPNRPEYVTMVRMAVSCIASRFNADLNTTDEMKMAISEACNHLIAETKNKKMEISFCINGKCLEFNIYNYNPGKISKKRTQLEREISKTFMKTFMDRVSYGKTLRMEKELCK